MPPKKTVRIAAGQRSQQGTPQPQTLPDPLDRSSSDEAAQPRDQEMDDLRQQLYNLQQQLDNNPESPYPSVEVPNNPAPPGGGDDPSDDDGNARRHLPSPRQHHGGSDPRRVPRMDHNEKLDDPRAKLGPEFDAWLVNVNGLLLDYGTAFPTDGAQARWLYKQTTGDAKS